MKNVRLFFLLTSTLLFSCSPAVFEAKQTHKMHDVCLLLRKNGHYTFRVKLMGVIPAQGDGRGRYILSRDTVYFVVKKSHGIYTTNGYGIIDTTYKTFTYQIGDDLPFPENSMSILLNKIGR